MDSYFSKSGLCHPSDNVGAVIAVSEHADRSGKDFSTALAIAYQVETALIVAAQFLAPGFDLTTALMYSIGAGLSRAFGLDEAKTSAAVEISRAAGIPLLVVWTTPISQWKGLNSSQVAFGCAHGFLLASRGVTGPKNVTEGPSGLAPLLGKTIHIDWDKQQLDCFDRLALKTYNPSRPSWPSSACSSRARPTRLIRPRSSAYGRMSSTTPTTHRRWAFRSEDRRPHEGRRRPKSPVLAAVAAQDGDVQTAQLEPRRIERPNVQGLLRRVEVRADDRLSARYPGEFPSHVTVRLEGG